jgi:hypothetical protein
MDHKQERKKDLDTILNSDHDRRVVVAGPGTGKSFLFQEAIKKAKKEGKNRFLAITFIGKLGDALADDLAGLADTVADSTMEELMQHVIDEKMQDREIFVRQLVDENRNLARPLGSMDITVCNILGSKGLGADVVFLIGFDQGKLPAKDVEVESEIYQMLVALTRAKKRIYLINTVGCQLSKFIDYIDSECREEI